MITSRPTALVYWTLIIAIYSLLCPQEYAYAAEEFIISDIRIEGLDRIEPGTVFNSLPIQVGDTFDDSRSADAVKALFKTGFFEDVRLERDGDVLVFVIKERPAIGSIEVSGNKDIKTEDLLKNLKQVGFVEGRVFYQAMLEQMDRELRKQYFSRGKYAAEVKTTTTPLENNRVAVKIDIFEGKPARIKKINIIGNTVWDEKHLLKKFSSDTGGIFSFFTKSNQYSREKLSADLEILRSYYQDNGYLKFNIDSTQISITPDRKGIYITINISEGEPFTISEAKLAGDFVLPEQDLRALVTLEEGELFSRKKIANIAERLTQKLGEQGYAFANVNPVPEVDEENKTVAMTFFIDPEKRVYVRRITFFGNDTTRDEVLRREMRQQESAWASTEQIERGRLRLQRTGFFSEVNVETVPVPGVDDQIDVHYTVEEQLSGSINFGIGASNEQNIIFRAGLRQRNFLGTGKHISFDFNTSSARQRYQLGYSNPYYTVDGISRGFTAFFRNSEADDQNLSDYSAREIGGSVNYGFPVSEYNSIYASAEYANTRLDVGSLTSTEIRDFVAAEGSRFDVISLGISYRFDKRNKAILPDRGGLIRLSSELAIPFFGNNLTFYKLNSRAQWFYPLIGGFVFSPSAEFGYGSGYGESDSLPFFKNFYAGGPDSVRGFRANTLGPKDSRGDPIGGEVKIIGSGEVFVPLPFLEQFQNSVRLLAFIDAGNVYDADNISLDELRYSGGVGGIWVSPLGQVGISFASPFGAQSGDEEQALQFNFGTTF